ncbi:MAG: hypothetical protein IT497_02715 [Ottowia sp.]|nr:hypothetical protein [Ottowia sp.]
MDGFLNLDALTCHPVSEDSVCLCCRDALTHHEYMTAHLQRVRACTLHIERRRQRQEGQNLIRHILLNDAHQHTHIIASVWISLAALPGSVHQQLIESDLPLGHILATLGIAPNFVDRYFFRCDAQRWGQNIQPYSVCSQGHFGRAHTLTDAHGRTLARVREWVA